MTLKQLALFLIFLVGFFAIAQITNAQTDPISEQGIKPYGSYHGGDIDVVSMVNGKLDLHAPLISFPQRGGLLHMGFTLRYQNPTINYIQECIQGTHCMILGSINAPAVQIVPDIQMSYGTTARSGGGVVYSIITADGSSHQLAQPSSGPSTGYESIDATSFHWDSTSKIAIDGNGVQYNLNPVAGSSYPSTIIDPNGNEITAGASSWTDSLGRTVPFPIGVSTEDFSGCPTAGLLPVTSATLWTVPSLSGGTMTYESCFATVSVSIPASGGNPAINQSIHVMQNLVLPNKTTWTFTYDTLGDLSQITLPTGGTIAYGWGTFEVCGTTSYPFHYFRAALGRTVNANDGSGPHTWAYSGGGTAWGPGDGPASFTNAVTDPFGNVSVHTMTNLGGCQFYETELQEYQGAQSPANLLRTTNTTYSFTAVGIPGAANVVPTVVTTVWPNNKTKEVDKTYDTPFSLVGGGTAIFGKVITETEYDYGADARGGILRTTTNAYEFQTNAAFKTANIINPLASVKIADSGGTQRAYTTYAYNAQGNQTGVSRWLNTTGGYLTSGATYFSTGELNVATDPKSNSTTYLYGPGNLGAYPTTITNALTQSVTNIYDLNSGLLTSTTDPNGQATTSTYDPSTWRKTQTNYPDGGQTNYCYSDTASEGCASGPPYQVNISKKITSSLTLTEVANIDGLGRSSENQLTSDPKGSDLTNITYDANGRKATITNPYRTSGNIDTSTEGSTSYQYDGLNRPTLVTKPDGSTVKTAYCANTTLVTDEAGHWRRSTTDGLGRLIEVDEPNSMTATVNANGCPGTGEPIWVTTYTYDALGDLTSVTQGGSRSRSFIFDSLKRMTSSTNPEAGTVTYTYDADGNVLTKTDARAVTITYGWDALNRMLSRTYSNGDPTVSYTYDQTSCVVVTTCYNIGRRTHMTDAGGSEAWAYDKMGREIGEQRSTNSISKNTGYTYNLDGSLATLVYPSGRTITYSYNAAAQSTQGLDVANGISYAADAFYIPSGALMTLSSGDTSLTTIYNSRLQPCWVYQSSISSLPWNDSCTQTVTTNGNILDLKYNFSLGADNGNVVAITNNRDTTRSQAFTYDQVNRIVSAQTPAPCGSNCWSQTFTYDQWANLQSVAATGTAPALPSLGVNTNNRVTLAGFNYDAAGNETSDVTNTYVWNAESEIKTAGGLNYSYDGDGDRVQKSNGKIYWYGAGSQILDESDASGNITDEYVYFDGKRVGHRVVSSNSVYYYAEDMLGSSRSMSTSTGTLCYDADFYPYGGEHDYTNTCAQNYKFTGKERDLETNNDDFDARYYSSAYGRFLSADWSSTPSPVPYANLTNPQTLNLYAMVSDNPESFADLDGHGCYGHSGSADSASCPAEGQGSASSGTQNPGTAQNQGAGQASGTATFNLGGVTVKFTWQVDQDRGGVDITATPTGCDGCKWAQTVSGTGVDQGGTKADIQRDSQGNESDAHKYPFTAPTERKGQLFDEPAKPVSPASQKFVSTVGSSDGKGFRPSGSLVWGYSKNANGDVSFSGVRPATASEQKQSLAIWSAKTGMAVDP